MSSGLGIVGLDRMCPGFGCTVFMIGNNLDKVMCDWCAKTFPEGKFLDMWQKGRQQMLELD